MKIYSLIVVMSLLCASMYSQEFKLYENKKNRFSILYPREWEKDVTARKRSYRFAIYPSESGIVIIPSVGVNLSITNTNNCTLDTLVYNHMKHFHLYHAEKVIEGGETIINGRNFYWYETLAENKNESVKRKHYLTIRNDKIFTISFKANTRSDYPKHQQTFDKILNSFVLLD